jgi:hypothetical protein
MHACKELKSLAVLVLNSLTVLIPSSPPPRISQVVGSQASTSQRFLKVPVSPWLHANSPVA